MKNMKRFIAALMAVIMIAAIPMSANAALFSWRNKTAETETTAEADAAVAEATEDMTEAAPEETTKAPEEKTTSSSSSFSLFSGRNTVAKMWVFVTFANPKVPHCWIYIVNLTDKPLKVCDNYSIKPHGDFSMGAFKARGTDGPGIYFNLERHWIKPETYGRAYCMSTNVSASEMQSVANAIKRHDYWNWGFNCCWFATSIWNICSPRKLLYLFSPYIMVGQMLVYGAKRPDFKIPKMADASQCYKYEDGKARQACWRATITNTGV